LLIPQRAVVETQGSYQVAVVDDNNTVSIEHVKVGDQIGTMWVIAEGLKPGQRVIAEGVQNARPGMKVNPKPVRSEANPLPKTSSSPIPCLRRAA
jgi:membrane fusion protein (multidrug efflux system)